jgi:hypothetical protein
LQFILALICFVSFSYGISLLEEGYAYLSYQLDPVLEREEEVEEGAAPPIDAPGAVDDYDVSRSQAEFDYNFGKFMVIVAIVFAFLAGAFR